MPECEISGKQVPKTIKVRIEGVVMHVAPEYANLGTVLEQPASVPPSYPKVGYKSAPVKKDVEHLVGDFGKKLKNAREAKGLRQEDLAKMMMEKTSTIHQVESGHLRPDDKLLTKFKHFLGVDLMRKFHDDESYTPKKSDKMTLGDLMGLK